MTESMTLIFANHEIHHNHAREYVTSERIDPVTGEFAVTGKVVKLAPGRIHEIPTALADELFGQAAKAAARNQPTCVREPDEREILSFRHSRGEFGAKS